MFVITRLIIHSLGIKICYYSEKYGCTVEKKKMTGRPTNNNNKTTKRMPGGGINCRSPP